VAAIGAVERLTGPLRWSTLKIGAPKCGVPEPSGRAKAPASGYVFRQSRLEASLRLALLGSEKPGPVR